MTPQSIKQRMKQSRQASKQISQQAEGQKITLQFKVYLLRRKLPHVGVAIPVLESVFILLLMFEFPCYVDISGPLSL